MCASISVRFGISEGDASHEISMKYNCLMSCWKKSTKCGRAVLMNLAKLWKKKANSVSQRKSKTKYLEKINADSQIDSMCWDSNLLVSKSSAKCGWAACNPWCPAQSPGAEFKLNRVRNSRNFALLIVISSCSALNGT